MLASSQLVRKTRLLSALHQEADELTRIFASAYNTARAKEEEEKQRRRKDRRSTDEPIDR